MQALGEKIPGSFALDNFCRQDGSQKEFTGELRSILEATATSGKYWHDWAQLKTLLCFRLTQVMKEYHESHMHVDESAPQLIRGEAFSDLLDRLLQGLESFTNGAPFTSQRLCELLLNPKDTYVNLDKLSLAFEKLLLVTSIEPASSDPYPSHLQPSTEHTEPPLQEQQVSDEGAPAVITVNGLLESNGEHKEVQDDEMVDVEGVVPPVEVENVQPFVSEGVSMPSVTSQTKEPEVPANGHVGPPVDEGSEDMALGDGSSPTVVE